MKGISLLILSSVFLLVGSFGLARAFEKKVVLGENFGATW